MQIDNVKIEVYVPASYLNEVMEAMSEAKAGEVGCYRKVSSSMPVQGTWMPVEGADPYDGEMNVLNHGLEYKLEMRCAYTQLSDVVQAIRMHHPYEEPLINLIPLLNEHALGRYHME